MVAFAFLCGFDFLFYCPANTKNGEVELFSDDIYEIHKDTF